MDSSNRKQRRAQESHTRKANRAVGVVDPEKLKKVLENLQESIGALQQIYNHNQQAVQQGFYLNDIWLQVLRNVISDQALDRLKLSKVEGEGIDWDTYWSEANKMILARMEERKEEQKPLIQVADNEEVVEFGGDVAKEVNDHEECGTEHSESSPQASGL